MSEITDKLKQFGFFKFDAWQPVSDADLKNYEEKIGIEFPQDYKEFLKEYSGQSFEREPRFPYLEDYPGGKHGIFSIFYGIMPGDSYDLIEAVNTYKGRINNDLLPIGEDPGGNIICLAVKGENSGKVYFWDHEEEKVVPNDSKTDDTNLYLVSNSFADFIQSLQLPEEN